MKFHQVQEALDSLRVITNETQMIVVGTQSLHGTHPDTPDRIMHSREVDVILLTKAALANWIGDVVGNETPFEAERGYFIDHVRPRPGLPVFAGGWENRLSDGGAINGCKISYLSPVDLAIAKLGAGREKDFPFVRGMIEQKIVSLDEIRSLIPLVDEPYREKVTSSLERIELRDRASKPAR